MISIHLEQCFSGEAVLGAEWRSEVIVVKVWMGYCCPWYCEWGFVVSDGIVPSNPNCQMCPTWLRSDRSTWYCTAQYFWTCSCFDGTNCGVGSQHNCSFFLAHNKWTTFSRQKVSYFNISKKNSLLPPFAHSGSLCYCHSHSLTLSSLWLSLAPSGSIWLATS